MIIPSNISNTTRRKCKKAGIHPQIVQSRMGHSSIKMTMDTYSHLIPGMQSVAVDAMQKICL